MKTRTISMMLTALLVAAPSCFCAAQTAGPFTGVWRGQIDGLPGVTLTVTDEGDGLSGAAVFYLLRRSDLPSVPTTATPGAPEPLMHVKAEGNALVFQVSHRRAHPPATLSDPPASFHLTLTGPGKAELYNDAEGPANGLGMVRSDQ